jgi:hypothetical protein
MRAIFVFFGQIVSSIGVGAALLLVGMLPMYVAAYFYKFKKIGFKSSGLSIAMYSLAILSTVLMSVIIMICAVVIGQWG